MVLMLPHTGHRAWKEDIPSGCKAEIHNAKKYGKRIIIAVHDSDFGVDFFEMDEEDSKSGCIETDSPFEFDHLFENEELWFGAQAEYSSSKSNNIILMLA